MIYIDFLCFLMIFHDFHKILPIFEGLESWGRLEEARGESGGGWRRFFIEFSLIFNEFPLISIDFY